MKRADSEVTGSRWAPCCEPQLQEIRAQRELGLIGVDEAGRGPLAGPVCAAAVVLPPDFELPLLTDSKKLTAPLRERLAVEIRARARAWALGWASAQEIDTVNILVATHRAMCRAVAALLRPEVGTDGDAADASSLAREVVAGMTVWVDGDRSPRRLGPCERVASVVRGDSRVAEISAASVLAKTARDRWMLDLHRKQSRYGFAEHKGYPTARHLALLAEHGPCSEHRRSFAPVAKALRARAVSEQIPTAGADDAPGRRR